MTVDTPPPAPSRPDAGSSPDPNPKRPGSARVTPHQPNLLQRTAAWLIAALIRVVSSTLRYRWERNPHEVLKDSRPYIFCTWHNRLALSIVIYRKFMRGAGLPEKMAAIVSASRDGALLARVLERLRVQPVRGSSSRRGGQAMLEMNTWLQRGYDVALTVDGPRGPRYEVKPGATGLAQLSGQPIVTVSYRLTRKWTLRSWDRFQIPVPFSTCIISFGDPIRVPREASDAEREAVRQQVEQSLQVITID